MDGPNALRSTRPADAALMRGNASPGRGLMVVGGFIGQGEHRPDRPASSTMSRAACQKGSGRACDAAALAESAAGAQHIALAAHGEKVAGLSRIVLDFAAQTHDLHIDGSIGAADPAARSKLRPADRASRLSRQEL